MGVCCIVFDIDGMLFEFFMNLLNIEKKKKCFLQYFKFSSCFMLFPTLNKKNGCNGFLTFYAISNISRKQNLGIQNNYFSFNVFFVFFLYAGNIVKCPFTYSYWLNGRWFLQILDIRNFIMRMEILKSSPSLTG